ncbi:MAG: hypothetical protein WBP26_03525 [Candidatus Saccharimonadales bacterium]
MVYQDFVRVNKIDTQITQLHNELMVLYSERAQLLGPKNLAPGFLPNLPTQTQNEFFAAPLNRGDSFFKSLYEYSTKDWGKYDIKLPRYKTLQIKFEKADMLIQDLTRKDNTLSRHLQIRLVPPLKTLKKVLTNPAVKKICGNDALPFLTKYKGSEKWRTVVVFDSSLQQRITDFSSFKPRAYGLDQSDVMALGVQEIIAVHLQNMTIVNDTSWLILTANKVDDTTIPCVRLKNDALHFSVDDSGGILGENYFNPVVAVE